MKPYYPPAPRPNSKPNPNPLTRNPSRDATPNPSTNQTFYSSTQHLRYHGAQEIVGYDTEVPVLTKSGKIVWCSLVLNEVAVKGGDTVFVSE